MQKKNVILHIEHQLYHPNEYQYYKRQRKAEQIKVYYLYGGLYTPTVRFGQYAVCTISAIKMEA